MSYTIEKKVDWLQRKGFIKEFRKLPFLYVPVDQRERKYPKTETRMMSVPLIDGLRVVDDYNDYMRDVGWKFDLEFSDYLLSL